jgi:carboxypeptidase C (cathepsin A)
MAGNAVVDINQTNFAWFENGATHSLIDPHVWDSIEGSCNFSIDLGIDGNGCPSHQTLECQQSIQIWLNSSGAASNELDLYDYYAEGSCSAATNSTVGMDAPCIEDRTTSYLQKPEVRAALHVSPEAAAWSGCSDALNDAYNCADTLVSMVPLYVALRSNGIKILIYSGDVDGIVPTAASRRWVERVAASDRNVRAREGTQSSSAHGNGDSGWRRWHLDDGLLAGYTFEVSDEKGQSLCFVTVKGAGHMVPRFKGQAAWEMASRFVHGIPF